MLDLFVQAIIELKGQALEESAPQKRIAPKVLAIIGALVVAFVLIAATLFAMKDYLLQNGLGSEEARIAAITMIEPASDHEIRVKNPIDFEAWQAQNPDIYAWISFPGTSIDGPIFQSSFDDIDFYLSHDINGSSSEIGSIYTQPYNSKDFQDPVTMVFGHTISNTEAPFTSLHGLESREGFDACPYFYICLPDKVLTYEVIAAQIVSDEHVLLTKDLDTSTGQQTYFDELLGPNESMQHLKEGAELIGGESRIVHLTTCTEPDIFDKRFMVTGRLVDWQKTQ